MLLIGAMKWTYWMGTVSAYLSMAAMLAQTDGTAHLEATLKDYTGTSGTKHWTVAWVTTESGAFIKTLRKQGPTLTASHWNSHCSAWYSAKNGSTAFDGYTSATASSYTGTNSPVILDWNCRDASGQLVKDGNYKFWVQYAEDSGQGPYTTGGLLWTKSTASATNTYPNQASNFASMKVVWTPVAPPSPPVIVSFGFDGKSLVLKGTGPSGLAFQTLASVEASLPLAQWSVVGSGQFDASGNFHQTNSVEAGVLSRYYRLKIP